MDSDQQHCSGKHGSFGHTLYANFTGYGLFQWNGTTWTQINPSVPASMVASDTALYANFTGYGIYKYEAGTWTSLSPTDPSIMIAGF